MGDSCLRIQSLAMGCVQWDDACSWCYISWGYGERVNDLFCVKVAMEEELCTSSRGVWCCGAERAVSNSDGTLGNDEET